MQFTLSWLKKFLDINKSLEEIAEALNNLGLEVDEVVHHEQGLENCVIVEVVDMHKHPNANKLNVCQVNIGTEVIQVVCGASNAKKGLKGVFAPIGTKIPKDNFIIQEVDIRGVKSYGMLCSEDELCLGKDSEKIIELPNNVKIGQKIVDYFNLNDPTINISITPNRSDCLGVYGIARDLAAKGMGTLLHPEIPKIETDNPLNIDINITDKKICPLFMAYEITDINNVPSPMWLQNILRNSGFKVISSLVDITNYICNSFGQPMHSFDRDKVKKMIIRNAKQNEKFIGLDDKEYDLNENDIVISDDTDVLSLAGILGGKNSGSFEDTKNIVLEAATFNPISIAKTGRRTKIVSDARYRFERGIDDEFRLEALSLGAKMVQDICGGKITGAKIIKGTPQKRQVKFFFAHFKKKIGIEIDHTRAKEILEKLGFTLEEIDGHSILLDIPSWRQDISIEEDVIEEILRIYGYDHIPLHHFSIESCIEVISTRKKRIQIAKRVFGNLGYHEVITWSFMSSNDAELFFPIKDSLKLINPISQELDYMRQTMLSNLLHGVISNFSRSITDVSLFEVGPIFVSPNHEKKSITGIRSGHNMCLNPHEKSRKFDVYDIKGDIELLLREFEIDFDQIKLKPPAVNYYHPGRSTTLILDDQVFGYFGEIHPQILSKFGIDERVVGFEIFIDDLSCSDSKKRVNLSEYQSVKRDFGFIIDENIYVGDMLIYIKTLDPHLIQEANVFDVYKGPNLPRGKKSVAFSLTIQADDRTLTQNELSDLSNKVIKSIENKFNAVLRKDFA